MIILKQSYTNSNYFHNMLISNIDRIHTTELGIERIKNNLKLDKIDVVNYLKDKIIDKECVVYKKGKNYYCEIDNIRITINSYNYCIITAHVIKNNTWQNRENDVML